MADFFEQRDEKPQSALLGHAEPARQVAESWHAGRMHHAWLLTGIEGIGKATFALRMAAFVLSGGKGTPDDPLAGDKQVRHALAETHPDLLVIRRSMDEKTGIYKQGIVVEDAHRVGEFLHKTSSYGGWRAVVIDEAHRLNRNAQNAILKILEEPPSRAMILMTTSTVGAMLPTIRSRCRVLPFMPLGDETMRELLGRHASGLSEEECAKLLPLAGGSIGAALRVLKTEGLRAYDELRGLFCDLPRIEVARLHKLADKMAAKSEIETFDVATDLFLETLRQDAAQAARNAQDYASVRRKLDTWESIRATLNMAGYANLDKKLALVNAFCALRKSG